MAGNRFEMQGISKAFGATQALNNVALTVRAGEVHALVGENGAGKSTLMKILSGAHQPDSGEMHFEGERYQPRNPMEARLKGVGMIYQELSLAPHLTVAENILLGMEPVRFGWLNRDEIRKRSLEALAHFDHPEVQPEMRVSDLSVSAQQLVEIGRSLAVGCRVLVFDEPTSSLSQNDIQRLFEIIKNLKSQGISIVYISHFLEEVREISDRLTVLRDGEVVDTRDTASTSPSVIVEMMVGREISNMYPRSKRERGKKILEIKNIAGKRRPTDASLDLHRGEVLGICGLVGAGRTELLRAIFGLEPVSSGEIRVASWSGPATPAKRWSQGVGLLSEDRKQEGLALNLSIADNVTLTSLDRFGRHNTVRPSQQNDATQEWVEKLDIRCQTPEQAVGDLSGGNQQKAAFARLLQHDVDILLLDEPTRGIDVAAKAKIYEVINELASAQKGKAKAILMISSYLPELLGVCDRIAVMHRGKLMPARPVAELDEHSLMLAATGQDAE